jgi:NADH:ubiquinone oxidoreductase subunit 6 (subunit J)
MADLIFIALMAVTIGGAILALESTEIVYGAIALSGSLFGVAAFFFLLNAPYVGVFQITVYVGAVAVLILFTVMLVRQEKWMKEVTYSVDRVAGILIGVAIVGTLTLAYTASKLYDVTTQQGTASFLQIGQLISTSLAPVLQILALVLAVSVIGALTLAKVDKEEDKQ